MKLIPTHKYDFDSGVDSIWMAKTITIIRFQYGDPQNTDTKGKQLICLVFLRVFIFLCSIENKSFKNFYQEILSEFEI